MPSAGNRSKRHLFSLAWRAGEPGQPLALKRRNAMANPTDSSNRSELNRRDVFVLAGAAVTTASSIIPQPVSAAIRPSDIVMMDAVGLAGAIRSRQVSCVEVMTAYLDHIEKINPKVNAIVALQDRAAL